MFDKQGVKVFSNNLIILLAKFSFSVIKIDYPLPHSADSIKYFLSFPLILSPTPIVWSLLSIEFPRIRDLKVSKLVTYPSVNIPPSLKSIIYLG